jgi:PAS domain S-box-containing protein
MWALFPFRFSNFHPACPLIQRREGYRLFHTQKNDETGVLSSWVNTMGKLFESALSRYSGQDYDLQLKARFFFGVNLFNLVMIFAIIAYSLYIQNIGFPDNEIIIALLALSLLFVSGAMILLIRGRFSLSTHLIILANQLTIWAVIAFDRSHVVSRLDTITYTFCIISLLPLCVKRNATVFFLYGSLNILFLFLYMFMNQGRFGLPPYVVIDFLADNTVAILIATITAFSVFTINRRALEKAKHEISERLQAERIVQHQKEELETVNRELSSALHRMEITTEELKKANEKLENTRIELIDSNILLKESEEKFSKIFHRSPLLVALMNLPEGRFTDFSDSFIDLLGRPPEAMIGKTSGEIGLWTSQAQYMQIKRIFKAGGKLKDEELAIQDEQKKDITILMSSEIVSIGQSPHIILMGVDITERKRAELEKKHLEDQLRQSQKMEAVGHLAGGIAHDFNNMLSVVIGNSDLLTMNNSLDPLVKTRINSIRDAAGRSANLVRQLLAFARKQTISPRVLNLNGAISGMLKMLHRLIGEDIDLEWIPGDDLPNILIDPSQIDQILANLMVNARDAISGVGKVTIETQTIDIDEAYCKGHAGFYPGTFSMLSVSDTGCGMTEKTLENIFEPFFTTKGVGRGTGLGLATVYGIVKQNDGFIHVYSEAGQGSTFKLYFPPARDVVTTEPTSAFAKEPSKGSGTVLIVEDDISILDIGRSILEQLGYTVLTANNPENALSMVRSHSGNIDLLITDVVMPVMNGKELAKILSEIKPGLRCLYMSGYTANVIAHHGVLDEGVIFLSKPFTVRDLSEKVREAWSAPSIKSGNF